MAVAKIKCLTRYQHLNENIDSIIEFETVIWQMIPNKLT